MGDRGQVHIKDENVWLYTHWGAYELVDKVRAALSKKWRWDDSEYLARIVFEQMIGNHRGGETGFGISGVPHDDVWRNVELDGANQRVVVSDHGEVEIDQSFSDFISDDEDDQ